MRDFLFHFTLCFVPLFVAVDPLGLLPVFVTVTAGFDAARRRRVLLQAVPTALAIGVGFLLVGRPLLSFLTIKVEDLQIAGGALLFIYAMMDMVMPSKPTVIEDHSLGIVPLATPLIVGPAVLTMGLMLVDRTPHPWKLWAPIAALVANLFILWGLFLGVDHVLRFIPLNAMRALSKVVDLLLAAIGVSFVRLGIVAAFGR